MSQPPKEPNKRKRLSLTAMPAGQPMTQPAPTAWMGPMGPMGMGPMGRAQLWNSPAMWMQPAGGSAAAGAQQPVMMAGPSTSSGTPDTRLKPWTADSSDSDYSEEDNKEDEEASSPVKKGSGRPVKKETLAREKAAREARIVKDYPKAFSGPDTYASDRKDECFRCRVYVGRVMIKPCGHAKYCQTCVNKLREESVKLNRPAKCPSSDCFQLMESWFRVFNLGPKIRIRKCEVLGYEALKPWSEKNQCTMYHSETQYRDPADNY
ncbi:putative E3 ubiquitin-protein ligase RNF217 [Frankliniella fusca]|uniref:E3 ubiquitin-protein ligase RNF217 n=1 Tax=Frankliniella fusca TaxID=407009 RepID=A0AAE1GXX1_9NEOP|nr:putative E3 ubiquitin-protein ligase RNF217 [Frankliniella fusca]